MAAAGAVVQRLCLVCFCPVWCFSCNNCRSGQRRIVSERDGGMDVYAADILWEIIEDME